MDVLAEALRESFNRYRDQPAVEGRTRCLSYGELDDVSRALASALREAGVGAGAVVPLALRRSLELVALQVALLRLGAGYAPLDLKSPPARQAEMLAALRSQLTVGEAGCPLAGLAGSRFLDVAELWPAHPERAPALPALAPPEGAPAYVMFTSGTTGVPKGVCVPRDGIRRLVCGADYAEFEPGRRWAFLSSPAFDASTLEVWGPLLSGGCCVVQEEETPSLDGLADFLLRERITDTWLTSALFSALVEDRPDALGGLRQLLTGGERVSPQHARALLVAYPGVRLINGYGPTENTTFTLCRAVTLADTFAPDGLPIGVPINGTVVRVEPAGSDERVGELWAGGRGVAYGYLGDPELTARRFVETGGVRYYRTGDLVREREDGVFEFLGRADRQVKIQGHRIELDAVERALATCPGVGDAAVLVAGEGAEARHLVACYTVLDGACANEADLARRLAEELPASALPRRYVALASFPLTLNGKIDRAALATAVAAGGGGFIGRLQEMFRTRAGCAAVEGEREAFNYAELERRSGAVASALAGAGVVPGERVALLLPRSPELVVAMLACVRCGAAYVPVDLASPPARVSRLLSALKPRFAVADGEHEALTASACRVFAALELEREGAAGPAPDWPSSGPETPLYVMFTSGSTGEPKGVVVPMRGLMALLVDGDGAAFPPDARWLQVTSPAFDISNLEVWGALLNGACCVVHEVALPALDALGAFIVARGITHAQLSTALFNALADTQLACFAGLSQLLVGGERVSPPHMRAFLEAHPGVRLINAYGPTETTIWSLMHAVTLADTESPAGVPIGRPIRGTVCAIEAEPGGAGELLIGGAGVACGYLNDPAKTAERFVERGGRRWYRTGDAVRLRDDGVYEFLGRLDRQVKIQGYRIELDEVELAVASCPGVGEVAVLTRGDEAGSRHLVAVYSGLAGAVPSQEEVARYAAERLPAAAVPKCFVYRERLPANTNGKVDRRALEASLDRAPPHAPEADAAVPDWESEDEAQLAEVWRRVLPKARLSRDTHFLRVGGTSLLALRVAEIVRRELRRDFSPVEVLREPVLSRQALRLAEAPPIEAHVAEAEGESGSVPLTRAQLALLAADRLDPTGCAYLVHVALRVGARFDAAAWRRAFQALARRHPALRLRVRDGASRPVATVLEALPDGWWQERAAACEAPGDLAWDDALLADVNRPLDLASGGCMRVTARALPDGGTLVVWTVHHAVIDEASIDRCLDELDALLRGEALPPVYGSPFAFPAVESAWTDRADVAAAAARLGLAWVGLEPPLGRAPGTGREVRFALDAGLCAALTRCCAEVGCTPFAPLLVAYGLALQEVFGPAFRFVSTPFSRRSEPELAEPVTYWLDVRFIEAGARPGERLEAVLGRVRSEVIGAQRPAFQPLDRVSEALGARDPAAARLLTLFGFTWRLSPARALRLGGAEAELLRVPQQAARYSLCLHAAQVGGGVTCSFEAVADAWERGRVEAVWEAFGRALAGVCAARPAGSPAVAAQAPAESPPCEHEEALRRAWSRWLGGGGGAVRPESDFLRSGGTSLTAMRLSAQVRRECGLKLDVGAFLARPTFANLCALAEPAARGGDATRWTLVGPADFERAVLVVPGTGGQVSGLLELSGALTRALPPRSAVVVVDLDALLCRAGEGLLWQATQGILQAAREIGLPRLLGLAGFSYGGLLGLAAARELAAARAVPVVLIDTYQPRALREGFWRKIERNVAWGLYGGRPPAAAPSANEATLEQVPLRTPAPVWERLHEELGEAFHGARKVPVCLLQASQTVRYAGLLWRRGSNGLLPSDYARLHVRRLDGAHLDLPRRLAEQTAELVATALLEEARGAGG